MVGFGLTQKEPTMKSLFALIATTALIAAPLAMLCGGCETTPKSKAGRANLVDDAQAALNKFQREDPSLRDFMSKAYGYAIFPDVGKGGVIVGGAYGKGVVYERGSMIG